MFTKHKQVREQCGAPDLQRSSFSLAMPSVHHHDGSSKVLLKFDVRSRMFVMSKTYNNFISFLSPFVSELGPNVKKIGVMWALSIEFRSHEHLRSDFRSGVKISVHVLSQL